MRKKLKKGSLSPSSSSSSSSSSSCASPFSPSYSNQSINTKKEESISTSTKKKTSQSKSIPNRKRKSNKLNKIEKNVIEKSKKKKKNVDEKDLKNFTPNVNKKMNTKIVIEKKSTRQALIHGLLISISREDRIIAIEALCKNLESTGKNPDKNIIDDHYDGIVPAICKQIMFTCTMNDVLFHINENNDNDEHQNEKQEQWNEIRLLLRTMELLLSNHWDPKILNQIFVKYGDFILSSVMDVLHQCMNNIETSQMNENFIIPTIISGTIIFKQCSRGSKQMRGKTLFFEGLLPILINLLNGTWLHNKPIGTRAITTPIRVNVMGTIANLPMDQNTMKYIAEFPLLLDSVMEILCNESGNLKEYAIVFMANMTYSDYCASLIIKSRPKIISSIAKLIGNETDIQMIRLSLRIIENFMKSEHAKIAVEKYALKNLLFLFQIRKITQKKILIEKNFNSIEDENLLRASKILLQLSETVSVAIMINKPNIIPKIVGAIFFCNNECENNSSHQLNLTNQKDKIQWNLQLNAIKLLTNFTFAIKSPSSPGYKDLIQSLTKLLSVKEYQDKICWLLLHQIGLDHDYDNNSSPQLAMISTDGLLEKLSSIILNNDSTILSSLRASAILLNLSSTNLCHATMITNKACMSAIINGSNKTKQTSDTPFEKEESKILLIRTAINLALNKSNRKKLERYEKIMQLLVAAASPRNMEFKGAKEAIWTLLQD